MTIAPSRQEPVTAPRSGDAVATPPVGQLRYDLLSGRWWWSRQTYALHGFEPDDVTPTTELFLAHRHPDDRPDVAKALRRAGEDGAPFTSVHRIVTARGRERTVCLVGQGRMDRATRRVVEVMGYLTDLTAPLARRAEALAQDQVRAVVENRATIEQAKGIVALTCDVSAHEAFSVLRAASNDHNVALRRLSGWVVALAEELSPPEDCRRSVSELLEHPRAPRRGQE